MVVIGVMLFSTMALVTPFLQNMLGYPIVTAGLLLASRGVGTLVAMFAVGRLMRYIEPRYLVLSGLILTAGTLHEMIGFTADTSQRTIVHHRHHPGLRPRLHLRAAHHGRVRDAAGHLRTDGTAILTLVRNVASSIGISIVIANLTSGTTEMHAQLAEYITPFNEALQDAGRRALRSISRPIRAARWPIRSSTQQATFIAYGNDFTLLMWLAIASMPFVFAIGKLHGKKPAGPAHAALD